MTKYLDSDKKTASKTGQNLTALKSNLTTYVESITQRSKNGLYVCPLCGSGTKGHSVGGERKADGAFSIYGNGMWCKCFSCHFGEGGNGKSKVADIFDLCAAVENISLPEATKRIIAMYGISATAAAPPRKPSPERKPTSQAGEAAADQQQPAPADYSADIGRFAEALPGSPGESYLQGRGLTPETMKRFHLGYDAKRQTVTIPYNPQGSYYGQRSVNPNSDRKHDNLKGVPMPLFNAAALYSAEVVFVVESPLCAISISQCGGAAVAISGTGGKSRLIEQLKRKPTSAALVICLDNDDAGRRAAEEMDKALTDTFHVDGTAAIMGEETDKDKPEFCKDPNEVLQRRGAEALTAAIAETIEATRQARQAVTQEADQERAQRTGAGMVDTFLQAIQTEKYKPLPTGINDIDKVLCGGLMRQQLVILGAAPGAGKTALAQWIFEGMAARGVASTVYLNLEMSREQILARSISRIAARQGAKVKPLEVMQGYKWTDAQRAAVLGAAEEYKQTIAPMMLYNPDGTTADLDSILNYLEGEAQRAEQAQQPAPVVVLDYLQLIAGQPREDAATVIKRAVAGLKGYAIRHDTIVFVIIAHNRAANSGGNVTMEAARDTSAIEYSADLQLGLTFTGCLREGKSPAELTKEDRHYITLRVVKGRFGGAGTDVDLFFDGETMTYTQIATDFTPYLGKTPFDAEEQKSKRKRL